MQIKMQAMIDKQLFSIQIQCMVSLSFLNLKSLTRTILWQNIFL